MSVRQFALIMYYIIPHAYLQSNYRIIFTLSSATYNLSLYHLQHGGRLTTINLMIYICSTHADWNTLPATSAVLTILPDVWELTGLAPL